LAKDEFGKTSFAAPAVGFLRAGTLQFQPHSLDFKMVKVVINSTAYVNFHPNLREFLCVDHLPDQCSAFDFKLPGALTF
jgi:hypothetical protein